MTGDLIAIDYNVRIIFIEKEKKKFKFSSVWPHIANQLHIVFLYEEAETGSLNIMKFFYL